MFVYFCNLTKWLSDFFQEVKHSFFCFFFWLSTFHAILDVLTADRVLIEHSRPEKKWENHFTAQSSRKWEDPNCETFFAESLEGVKIFHMNSAEIQRNSPEDSDVLGVKVCCCSHFTFFLLSLRVINEIRFHSCDLAVLQAQQQQHEEEDEKKVEKFLRLVPGRNSVCIDGVKLNQRAQLLRKCVFVDTIRRTAR